MAGKSFNDAKERVLDYVTAYTDEHGFSPTYREISAAVGFKSCATAHRYIAMLEQEEKLVLQSQRARTIKPLRTVALGATQQRVRLTMADGGEVSFDCVFDGDVGIPVGMTFTGVFDATRLKSKLGPLVGCSMGEEV